MKKPKKPPTAFEVEFRGPGVYPELIPLGALSRALTAVQRLAVGHDTPQNDDDEEGSEPSVGGNVGLLQVIRGSAIYQIATPAPLAVQNLRETGDVLKEPDSLGDRDYILGPLDELSSVAKSLSAIIIIKQPGRGGVVLATIAGNSYANLSEKLLITGNTTLFGRVERVGGATANKCGLRIANRSRMLFCEVPTQSIARLLGEKLYEDVAVRGLATWIKTTWRVVGFKIHTVSQPRLGSAREMIDALRNAGGSDWDKIDDPEAFLKETVGAR